MSGAAGTMRAAVLAGPGRVRIDEVARPEPGPGQVRLRLEGCGVCASNLTPWAGPDWMQFPTEPGALGHEGWGMVDALGDGVEELRVGDASRRSPTRPMPSTTSPRAEAVVPLPAALAGQAVPGRAARLRHEHLSAQRRSRPGRRSPSSASAFSARS